MKLKKIQTSFKKFGLFAMLFFSNNNITLFKFVTSNKIHHKQLFKTWLYNSFNW